MADQELMCAKTKRSVRCFTMFCLGSCLSAPISCVLAAGNHEEESKKTTICKRSEAKISCLESADLGENETTKEKRKSLSSAAWLVQSNI